jgi:hypothetical protein
MKKLDKDIEIQRMRLNKKKNAAKGIGPSREEMALKEFKQRLSKKGMTPEAFYRICDTNYKKTITVDQFKNTLDTFKLQLTRG